MRSCKEINQNVDAHLDGELSLMQRVELRLHMLMCVDCRRYIRQLKNSVTAFRSIEKAKCSDEQLDSLLNVLDDDGPEQP